MREIGSPFFYCSPISHEPGDLTSKKDIPPMLLSIHPKLPMRRKSATRDFYVGLLGFEELGDPGFDQYFMIAKDMIEIHFFLFQTLRPEDNYGQIYIRTIGIEEVYRYFIDLNIPIHPNGSFAIKPWGQKEFSIPDPDNNLLTFGQPI
jgi:catechol 2,3-dioxygenase-like lactoylglutathione lyase family enzyme